MNIQKFCKCCGIEIKEDDVIFNNLLKRFMHLFKFNNIDDTINEQYLMLSLIFNDSYMILNIDDKLRCVSGSIGGELDFYGYPTRYLWSTGTHSGNNLLTDGVIGHSNSLWTPIAPTIKYYSDMLANFDTSLKIASINTRTVPLYGATSDAERKQVNDVFEQLEKGNVTHTFLQKKTLNDLMDNNSNIPIDFTGKSADKQYIPMLLQAYDNVLARVCRELGINITNVMKKAQVISAEVNGYENYTQIFLDDMIENITKTFNEVNERYGTNWSVELSQAFQDDNAINEPDNEPNNEPNNEPDNEPNNE